MSDLRNITVNNVFTISAHYTNFKQFITTKLNLNLLENTFIIGYKNVYSDSEYQYHFL